MSLSEQYLAVRQASEAICRPLQKEDYVVQPVADVSPPKWHLGHTTWFWETFVLAKYKTGYRVFNAEYNYVFNSYYETIGARVIRTDRGNLSRPSVDDVYTYRKYVDEAMMELLEETETALLQSDVVATGNDPGSLELRGKMVQAGLAIVEQDRASLERTVLLGLNHEQQHQELLWTDIKYILGHNPLFPAYSEEGAIDRSGSDHGIQAIIDRSKAERAAAARWLDMPAGIYEIGFKGSGFCFDNELAVHKVYLQPYSISSSLVTNGEYMSFMEAGGYSNFIYWHAEGWDWVKKNDIMAPLYWHQIDNTWYHYTLSGLQPVALNEPVAHVSYYEAVAFAAWKGKRLPTEWEWEAASGEFSWGKRWEWTESAYLPYPGFKKAEGAIGEYNGKFMVSQMILRGASVATPAHHSRKTYRNFFHPPLRWQFTGIRLAL